MVAPPKDEQRTTAPDLRPEGEQPPWRRDFPIDWPTDHYVSRRDFTKFLGLTSFAFVVGQSWIVVKSWLRRGSAPPAARAVARLAESPAAGEHAALPAIKAGGAIVFRYPEPSDPCLLLRPDSDTLLAYHQKCTHLACAVVPQMDQGRLLCPCHQGYFDLATGRPLAGPPRRPLPRVTLAVTDGVVYATGVELRS
jgi:Rieske Fe-S protein